VDLTKEVLRYKFNEYFILLKNAYLQKDTNAFRLIYLLLILNLYQVKSKIFYCNSDVAKKMIQILTDMDTLLASDSHFLLGNWIESAKSKATNKKELDYYEWNARIQLTLWVWGENR
jgi:alpha-N-acetylglucosaminidase